MNIFVKLFRWLFPKKAQSSLTSSPILSVPDYTPLPVPCLCFTVYGASGEMGPSYAVEYIDCNNKSVTTYVQPRETIKFCAKSGSVSTYASYTCTKCTSECTSKVGIVDGN